MAKCRGRRTAERSESAFKLTSNFNRQIHDRHTDESSTNWTKRPECLGRFALALGGRVRAIMISMCLASRDAT